MKFGLSTRIAIVLFLLVVTAAAGLTLLAMPGGLVMRGMGGLLLAAALGLAGLFHHILVRPFHRILQAMDAFGQNSDAAVPPEELGSLGPLGKAFNAMVHEVRKREVRMFARKAAEEAASSDGQKSRAAILVEMETALAVKEAALTEQEQQIQAHKSEQQQQMRSLQERELALVAERDKCARLQRAGEETRALQEARQREQDERHASLEIRAHALEEHRATLERFSREIEEKQRVLDGYSRSLEENQVNLEKRQQELERHALLLDETRENQTRNQQNLEQTRTELEAQQQQLEAARRLLAQREESLGQTHATLLARAEAAEESCQRLEADLHEEEEKKQSLEADLRAEEEKTRNLEAELRTAEEHSQRLTVGARDWEEERKRLLAALQEGEQRRFALEQEQHRHTQELRERGKDLVALERSSRERMGELERQLAQERTRLQDAEGQLEALHQALNQQVLISVTDSAGVILEVNDAFCRVSQYSREELIGHTHRLVGSDFHPPVFFEMMWRALLAGEVWHGSFRNRAKDGSFYWVNGAIVPIRDRSGSLTRFIALHADVTRHMEAERQLAARDLFLKHLSENMGEGVYALDTAGRTTFVNPEAERMLGWRSEELLGRKLHDIIHFQNVTGDKIPAEKCPVHICIQQGKVYRVDKDVFTHKDGHLIPVTFISSPLLEDTGVSGSVTIFQDITARQRVEEEIKQARDIALEAARLKSEFLANMSHEIRTPMNGIIGMTGLLMESKLNKEQKDYATTIRDSAQALLTIINDILDFSKIEAGKLGILSIDFNPVKVVEGVAELMGPPAHRKSLSLLTDLDPQLPTMLRGDPWRLRQVLLNLTSNAVKFTKKGEVVISVRQLENSNGHVMVQFSVTDTGIGIQKTSLHRLFQPFVQVDGSTTREFGGSGLGLSISHRLVELMGGEIGVESKKGKGSTFWFSVPLGRSTAPQDEATPVESVARLKGVKVLLVDRNQTSQTILLNHLLNWNLKGTAVESPQEAMDHLLHEAAAGNPYALVIVDCANPAEESLELGLKVSNDPGLTSTGLILLTTINEKAHFEAAQLAGFSAHLLKPIRRSQLLECMFSVLFADPKGEERVAPLPSDSPLLSRSSLPDPSEEAKAGRLVLLAEDNAVNQKVIQMHINRLGYAVQLASNGREAVHAARATRFGMILMDTQMPIMNGFQAVRAIRRMESEAGTPRVPVMALTAKFVPGSREQCLECGMDDYLGKPVQFEELAEKLSHWLPPRKGEEIPPTLAEEEEERTTGGKEPPIEMSRLEGYFGGDRKTVRDFLLGYLSFVESFMNTLKKRLKLKEETIARASTELAEACTNAGATPMAALCRQLEEAANARDWERCRTLMDKMQRQYQRIEEFIKGY